jgi:hypothetical protein
VKRLLLLAVLLAVVVPGTANAAGSTACRNKIYNDWYPDGKIASTYPLACYRDALKHLNTDAKVYSSLGDDIRAAMNAATRRAHGLKAPLQVGHGAKAIGANSVKSSLISLHSAPHDPALSTGVVATASGAPLPILVLGGIALALAGAGAIGVGVRHARSRRR